MKYNKIQYLHLHLHISVLGLKTMIKKQSAVQCGEVDNNWAYTSLHIHL